MSPATNTAKIRISPAFTPRSTALSIRARSLSKAFDARKVIVDLDLDVPAGQFVAVVGRSGCGKSTLLRLLSGLEAADGGTLRLGQTTAKPNVRLMFQEPRLLPWAKVAANVTVGLGETVGPRVARERALAALHDVGLEDRADAWPSTLSGGQRQRVALARALVSGPGLLALDEPLGALDALTRIEMQQLIERVAARDGFTSVLVTHDVGEAVALADRVLVLERGSVTLDLPIDLPRPRHRTSRAAEIEERILAQLLGKSEASVERAVSTVASGDQS